MANELKTEPGWKRARIPRPWWAVAIAGGFGAVLAVLFTLGLVHGPAAEAQPVRTSASAAQEDRDARLSRIESKVDEALQRIAHIEGRMDRK